jgi:hypothetical protein
MTIFAVAIGVSLYIGVQWKLNEDLKYLSSKYSGDVRFEYGSAALSLAGTVIVTDIDLFFPKQNIKMSINELKYSAGSIFEMAFLRQQSDRTDFPDTLYLSIKEAIIPLEPSLVKLIASADSRTTWDAINASACGKIKQLGLNEYFSMGYDYIVFSSEANFRQDGLSGNLLGEGWIDVEETSKLDYQFNISGLFNNSRDVQLKGPTPVIEQLMFDLVDQGYNRHRNEFCSLKAGIKTEEYIVQHIKTIKQKLASVGIKMTLAGQRAYKNYLQPNSELQISLNPQVSFTFADFGYYDEQEIRDLLDLELKINQQIITRVFNNWALDKFDKIVINDNSSVDSSIEKRFETVIIHRAFRREPVNNATNFTDFEVKVVRLNGKEIIGKLKGIKKQRLHIAKSMEGGIVEVSLPIGEIRDFYVYR